MSSRRILIVSPDSYGLGHYRRCLTIARELLARDPSLAVLCLTGSARPDVFHAPSGLDIVKLPTLTKSPSGDYRPLADNLDLDRVAQLRGAIVASAVREFQPDVMLVDHAPLGTLGELAPVLEEVRRDRRITTVLGLRDIIDSPQRTLAEWDANDLRRRVRELYDHVLIYGDPRVFESAREYGLGDQARYTGIVCRCLPRAAATSRFDPYERTGRILITTGGGCDGLPIVEDALAVLAGWRGPVRAILGPLSDPAQVSRIEKLAAAIPSCQLLRASRAMCRELREADAVIAMAGYNTAYEVVSARRPYFVVPRHGPRLEQRVRAEQLERLGLGRSIESDPTARRAALARALEAEPPIAAERLPDLRGGEQAAIELLACLGARSRAALHGAARDTTAAAAAATRGAAR